MTDPAAPPPRPLREQLDDIIEQHLDFVHRDGEPVDLAALPAALAAEAEPLLDVLDLLVRSGRRRVTAPTRSAYLRHSRWDAPRRTAGERDRPSQCLRG